VRFRPVYRHLRVWIFFTFCPFLPVFDVNSCSERCGNPLFPVGSGIFLLKVGYSCSRWLIPAFHHSLGESLLTPVFYRCFSSHFSGINGYFLLRPVSEVPINRPKRAETRRKVLFSTMRHILAHPHLSVKPAYKPGGNCSSRSGISRSSGCKTGWKQVIIPTQFLTFFPVL